MISLAALTLTFALLVAGQGDDEVKSFEGHKVVSMLMRHRRDAELVEALEKLGADLWTSHLFENANATMLLSPELAQVATSMMQQQQVPHWIINDNIQEAIDNEKVQNDARSRRRQSSVVGRFARYNEIEAWLNDIAATCNNLCVLEKTGRSYENRQLYVMRIGENIKTGRQLPRIFTDSTIHAREWLAQAAHIWIIDQMIRKFGTDAAITNALKKFEFNFVVVANPDGYEFSHTNNRMWRKTRMVNPGSACRGVDPNRNFEFAWAGEGTSSSPCSEIYHGPAPFSEPETQAVSSYILKYKSITHAYIAQHTYCQMILVPYGHTMDSYPPDYSELLSMAQSMSSAMRSATGKIYQAGNTATLLSPGAGGSDDWSKGGAGIKYSYTIELRPTCGASNGFIVDPSEIEPAGTELLAALTTLASNINV